MTPEDALGALEARANGEKAAQMAAYHKVDRRYLGVPNPDLDAMVRDWRRDLPLGARLDLAAKLWASNIHEGRVAAAKLLTQARMAEDAAVWQMILGWVPEFDAWAVADHACIAGAKRLAADPTRLEEVEGWTASAHLWSRRAALVITLPFTKSRHPKPEELAIRERVLGWMESYVHSPEWFEQKAVAWWLRELSKKDPERVRTFLALHGKTMAGFARREASKYLPRLPDPEPQDDQPPA